MRDDDRLRWAQALTTAGWLFVIGYMAFVTATFLLFQRRDITD